MPIPTDERTCRTCIFYERYKGGETATIGQCRRYAMRPQESSIAQWPDTSDALWCGEWSDVHPYDRQRVIDATMQATHDAQASVREHFNHVGEALNEARGALVGTMVRGDGPRRPTDPQ